MRHRHLDSHLTRSGLPLNQLQQEVTSPTDCNELLSRIWVCCFIRVKRCTPLAVFTVDLSSSLWKFARIKAQHRCGIMLCEIKLALLSIEFGDTFNVFFCI